MSTNKDLTNREKGILALVSLNDAEDRSRRIDRTLRIGRLTIRYRRRPRAEFWGRFGGGWNWHVGIQASGATVMVFLLVASVTINLAKSEDGT